MNAVTLKHAPDRAKTANQVNALNYLILSAIKSQSKKHIYYSHTVVRSDSSTLTWIIKRITFQISCLIDIFCFTVLCKTLGRENDNCAGLKLPRYTCVVSAARWTIGPWSQHHRICLLLYYMKKEKIWDVMQLGDTYMYCLSLFFTFFMWWLTDSMMMRTCEHVLIYINTLQRLREQLSEQIKDKCTNWKVEHVEANFSNLTHFF